MNIRATSLHNERLSDYAKVVNYLHKTYATNDIIAHANKEFESYKQAPQISAARYAKRI